MPHTRQLNTQAIAWNYVTLGGLSTQVVSLNGTWKTDSISFTVDPLYRYTVHVRNSASIGATSINIDFIEVYGEASASYLTCSEDSGGYRYGFNGQEKDNEITGVEGSHNTAEFWMYDTRLGRRWNVDPIIKFYESTYATFGNNPILNIDLDGRDSTTYLFSGRNRKGALLFTVDEMEEVAKNSEAIDRLNGITYTKYKVFESKEAFYNAVKNGEVRLDQYSDLAYQFTEGGTAGHYGDTFRGGQSIGEFNINGGEIYFMQIKNALPNNPEFVNASAGKVLAHERLVHGYGEIYRDIFDDDKYIDPSHESGGLAAFSNLLHYKSYPQTLRSEEVLNGDYKNMIKRLHSIGPSLRKMNLDPAESFPYFPNYCDDYKGSLNKAAMEQYKSPLFRTFLFTEIIKRLKIR